MDKFELIKKIRIKKEFSQLPEKDVELAFSFFERREISDEEKIKLTRELLHKVFGAFGSRKIFSVKKRDVEWILKKHLSARERFPFYKEIYKRILSGLKKEITIVDLGAGINGLSFSYFKEAGFNTEYFAIESVGQFVTLMNDYFKEQKINGKAFNFSIFETEKLNDFIRKFLKKKQIVVFLFKVLDSLETLRRDYSKELILELSKISERIVVSFPTESMIKRKKFRANRSWILNFIKDNFNILDDFQLGSERFIVFGKI